MLRETVNWNPNPNLQTSLDGRNLSKFLSGFTRL
uniref:Uncharacterized protein n=1 Tax=Rhizophora mucronata TaxID=61149 RepID=A0A2P2LCD5_RHIMU